jgi:hypothetical protein
MSTTASFLIAALLVSDIATAETGSEYLGSEEWQQRRLFNPTPNELQQESTGRIFIYDGVKEADVERAMDDEFQRIESMMFIRTKRLSPEGDTVAYEDDDC